MNQAAKFSKWGAHSQTAARVDLVVSNNGTWSDAFQFGDPEDFSWNLEGCTFELDVQRNPYDVTPLVSLSTGNGRILTDSTAQRVIHFDLTASDIQDSLQPGVYVYDLVMIDATTVRVPLLYGTLTVTQGVTFPA